MIDSVNEFGFYIVIVFEIVIVYVRLNNDVY